MRKQVSLKTYVVSILLISLLFLAMITYIWANPSSSEIGIEEYSFESEASYTISKHESTIYLKNGDTGEIETSGTNASQILNWAIAKLVSGGKIFVKAGQYLIDYWIHLILGIIIEGEGEATVFKQSDGADLDYMFYADAYGRFQLLNFVIDGNKDNQNGGLGYGIYSDTYSATTHDNVVMRELYIHDTYGTGVFTDGNWYFLENVRVRDAGGEGFEFDDYRVKAVGCVARGCAYNGFYLHGTGLHFLYGCSAYDCAFCGFNMTGKDVSGWLRSQIIGGEASSNTRHGLVFNGVMMTSVTSVYFSGNGGDGSYDNIHFESHASYHSTSNLVSSCTFRSNGKSGYHVREADSNQNFNLILGSNLYDDAETANISLQGANSTEAHTIGAP